MFKQVSINDNIEHNPLKNQNLKEIEINLDLNTLKLHFTIKD